MNVLKFLILLTLFVTLLANEMPLYPEDDLTMDWGRTANGTIPPFPFTWDRDKFMLLPNREGQLELVDRNSVYQTRLESRTFEVAGKVQFLFYSSFSGGSPVELSVDQILNFTDHGFGKVLPTKILIHDWIGRSESEMIEPLAKEYLKKGDVNVIGVIWTKGATNYAVAAYRVPKVAELVTKVVDKLLDLVR